MLNKILITASFINGIVCLTASSAVAQAIKVYPYEVRPGSDLDAFINWAADVGSTLLDKTLTGRLLRPTPALETGYPETFAYLQQRRYGRRSHSPTTAWAKVRSNPLLD